VQLFDYLDFEEEELSKDAFPVTYANISSQQQKDPLVRNLIGMSNKYTLDLHSTFRGAEKQCQLVIFKQKIAISQALQK
jgi:hypothetical protein